LSITADFFKWALANQYLHGDPTLAIDRARKRQFHRETFSADDRRAILAANPYLRDRIALRLLLDLGLRKGALRRIQFEHFDHQRKRLTIFTKGEKVRTLPIPEPSFWMDLEHHILNVGAQPKHYLMASSKVTPTAGRRYYPDKPMSESAGMHRWWYRCLEN